MAALKDELLVFGWVRMEYDETVPMDVCDLCFKFYHLLAEILTFSEEYRSSVGVELSEDKTYVIKQSYGHKYVLTTAEPVFSGIHCWRVLVESIWIGRYTIWMICAYIYT